jgi:hypothetical protein
LERNWSEPPNLRRGGLSGVCRKEWIDPESGGRAIYYAKFQENHCCRDWTTPLRCIPTARREFKNQLFFAKHGIRAVEPVYYAESRSGGRARAILITRGLEGRPLGDVLREQPLDGDLSARLAELFHRIHKLGVRHGGLEPKHVWIDAAGPIVIDLEYARRFRVLRGSPTGELKKFFRNLRKQCRAGMPAQQDLLRRYLALSGRQDTFDKWASACELRRPKPRKRPRLAESERARDAYRTAG